MGAAGTVVARPDAAPRWAVGGSSIGDQRGVVADPYRLSMAGSAQRLWALEDCLPPASPLVSRWDLAKILDGLRRGCDQSAEADTGGRVE